MANISTPIKIREIMSFGDFIKKGREHLGVSLEKAAKEIGISPSYLSDFENNRATKIKMDFIYSMANFYGLNVDELCVSAGKIPKDIYYKISENPKMFDIIRSLKV